MISRGYMWHGKRTKLWDYESKFGVEANASSLRLGRESGQLELLTVGSKFAHITTFNAKTSGG